MERENQREYPVFEQMSTEELEKLLAQDFAASDGEEPDVDYIMAIMGVINEREKAAGCRSDVDAAWKEFQEEYQGQAAAFKRTGPCEAESSDHHQTLHAQPARKKHTRVFRYVLVAAVLVALLCGTASGFDRVFQAVVNWTAETFGFESPYGEETAAENTAYADPYQKLRNTVAEYTDLPIVPKWAPDGVVFLSDIGVQITGRKGSTHLTGVYETDKGQFVIRYYIHNENPPKCTVSYQWNETDDVTTYTVNGMDHDIVYNYEKNTAAWTNENVECMIQGALSVEELETMIDSIYEE